MSKVHTDEDIAKANVGEVQELNDKVILSEYNPQWPKDYETLKKKIQQALSHLDIQIEHVGSTSVPGLMAKPIIDIVLIVPDSRDELSYIPPLEEQNFWLKIREPDWFEHRMLKSHDFQVNLHVFSRDCSEVEMMIKFRDHLINNKGDFLLYQKTKKDLSKRVWKYTQNYADAKSEVVRDIFSRIKS